MTAVDVDALDKLREALAVALHSIGQEDGSGRNCSICISDADALLPTVERIANERAAAALREAASDVDDGEFSDRWSDAARRALLARADHLDPQ